jgi:phenylacetate-CoA ligase
MLIIRGVNVFPSQIESVLIARRELAPYYLLIVDRKGRMDTLEVNIEIKEKALTGTKKDLQHMEKEIESDIKEMFGFSCKVRLVKPKTIQRSEGKATRVIDKRKM